MTRMPLWFWEEPYHYQNKELHAHINRMFVKVLKWLKEGNLS